jgi:hypothetical protein
MQAAQTLQVLGVADQTHGVAQAHNGAGLICMHLLPTA